MADRLTFRPKHFTKFSVGLVNGTTQSKALEAINRLAELEDAEEQRNKGCNYCVEQEDIAFGMDSTNRTAYIYLDDNVLTADLYSESMAVAICFCPMCGRKLLEDNP